MKFRMVDQIIEYSENESIKTGKAVSFEEFSLLKRWGRKGEFPETLTLQFAVESAALLTAVSTDFIRICMLDTIDRVHYYRQTAPGCRLLGEINIIKNMNEFNQFEFVINSDNGILADGRFTSNVVTLNTYYDPENYKLMWKEIYDKTS